MSCDFYLDTWGAHYEVEGVDPQGPLQLRGGAEAPLVVEVPGICDFSSGLTLEIWLALEEGTPGGTIFWLQAASELPGVNTDGPFVALSLGTADHEAGTGKDLLWQAAVGRGAEHRSPTLVRFKEAQASVKPRGEVVARTVAIHVVLQKGVGGALDSLQCFRDGLQYGEVKSADLAALLAHGAFRLVFGGSSEEEASATIFLVRLYKGALEPAAITLSCSSFGEFTCPRPCCWRPCQQPARRNLNLPVQSESSCRQRITVEAVALFGAILVKAYVSCVALPRI
jgi:hypothetical protein